MGKGNMKEIISRADDCGSSHAANAAIFETIEIGFIKNVSVMGCGPYLEEAAQMLAERREICFGLHGCINSEWSNVVWGPVAPKEKVKSLIDARGVFFPSQKDFLKHPPVLEEIITEYRYQLERVRKVGFDVRYMDSHMFPELFIPGLEEAMSRMIEQEGLVDHRYFNRILPGNDLFTSKKGMFEKILAKINGQYLFVMHPAKYSEEMCRMGNAEIDGKCVAECREKDYQFLTDLANVKLCKKYGVRLLRYDEAEKPLEEYRLNLRDFRKELNEDDFL